MYVGRGAIRNNGDSVRIETKETKERSPTGVVWDKERDNRNKGDFLSLRQHDIKN